MKPILLRKQLLPLLMLFSVALLPLCSRAQGTTLSAGNIIFTGFTSLGTAASNKPDTFSFVLMRDIAVNTKICFTDRGYFQPLSAWQASNSNTEGVIYWVSGSALSAGTEVTIQGLGSNAAVVNGVANGSVTNVDANATIGIALGNTGDQLIAFQDANNNPAAGTRIAGLSWSYCPAGTTDAGWDPASCTNLSNNPSQSSMPPGLVAGYSALFMGNTGSTTGETYIQAKFTCNGVPSTDTAGVRAAVMNISNWTRSTSSTPVIDLPPACTYLSACVPPVFSINPPNRTICLAGITTFNATASNASSYKWQVNTGSGFNDITNGGVYSGAGTSTLTITGATTAMNGYTYRAVATNSAAGGCSTNSNVGTLTVITIATTGTKTDLLCNGVCIGSATAGASGGIGNYTYSWSPSGGTSPTATGLCATTYTVTVTDELGCQATRNFIITQPTAITTTAVTQTDVTCAGGNNGSATVGASGGTGSTYTYSWSPSGGAAATASNLTANTYTVTVKDQNNCQATRNFTIAQPSAIVLLAIGDATICAGQSTPLNAGVAGGTPPFTYQWTPGPLNGVSQSVSPDVTTNYVVRATDNNNCIKTDTVTVTVNANIAQAVAGTGAPVAGTASSNSGQTASGLQSFYTPGNCAIIASVQDNAGLGTVTAAVTAGTTVPVIMGRPYVSRWYQITPQNNVPAQVVLYFTQADFNLYNTYAQGAGLPRLPQNPTDQVGIDSLVITKTNGGPVGTGSNSLIHPTSVVWDAVLKYWKVTLTAPSFSYFYVHANNASNTPLPVTMGSFTVAKAQQQALLSWTTVQEENNKGFVIERSADGKQFFAIGEQRSLAQDGNSKEALQYRFTDVQPLSGMNYYRLAQEDRDGNYHYSGIRSLDFSPATPFRIYPNPADDVLKITYTAKDASGVIIRLSDMTGRIVLTKEWATAKGGNLYQLSLNGIPQGVYHLGISDASGMVQRVKIVKK